MALFEFSAYPDNTVACAKTKEFQLKDCSKERKLSTNTFMEEVKPIEMEK